jgi:hypothetical protein
MIHQGLYAFEAYYSFEKLPNGMNKISYPKEDNRYKIEFLASGPAFELVSNALIESTFINHITGEPFKITTIFNKQIFQKAIVEINFPDNPELQTIHVNKVNIDLVDYNLIKLVVKQWRKDVL